MELKKLVEEVEFKEEIKVLNKLIVETVKSLVEKEYEIKLDENVSACANLVRGTDDVTLSNALNTLSKEKLALEQGQVPEKNYSGVLTKSGSSLISCIEDIKANLGAKKCDVTVNDPEVKKNFVEFITSKIKDQSFDKEMMNILNSWKLNKIPNIKDAINLLATKFNGLLTV